MCEAQGRLGNKWSEISKLLPGRAENAVKNRFNSIVTKRLAQEGGLVKGSVFKKASKGHKGKQQRPVKEELGGEGGAARDAAPLIKRQVITIPCCGRQTAWYLYHSLHPVIPFSPASWLSRT